MFKQYLLKIKSLVLTIARFILPLSFKNFLLRVYAPHRPTAFFRYYKKHPDLAAQAEDELLYLKSYKGTDLPMLPYKWREEYYNLAVSAFTDSKTGMIYVMHGNNRLYFPRSWSISVVIDSYRTLMAEQDPRSPHRYLDSNLPLDDVAVLIDVGSSEGIFPLDMISAGFNLDKIILLEADPVWIEALTQTFAPWAHIIEILPKYAMDKTSGDTAIAVDDLGLSDNDYTLIKLDVEGAESKVLEGASHLIANGKLVSIICTYHKPSDASEFEELLKNNGYATSYSKGWINMLTWSPYLRKGVLRGIPKSQ